MRRLPKWLREHEGERRRENELMLRLMIEGAKPACSVDSDLKYLVRRARRRGLVVCGGRTPDGHPCAYNISRRERMRSVVSTRSIADVGADLERVRALYREIGDLTPADALERMGNVIYVARRGRERDDITREFPLVSHMEVMAGLLYGYKPCCCRNFWAVETIRARLLGYGPVGRAVQRAWQALGTLPRLWQGGNVGPPMRCFRHRNVPTEEYFLE